MTVAAKHEAMDKVMEEGTNKYQPLFHDLYTKYKDSLNTLQVHSGIDLMHRVKEDNKFMDIYNLLSNHRKEVDAYVASLRETNNLTEKKGTLCGRCGHVHVKGTPCPRPFKEGELTERIDFDEALNLRAIKVEIEDEIKQLYIDMEQEAEPEGGEIANRYGNALNKLEDRLYRVKKQLDDYDMNEGVAKMTAKYDDAPELKGGQKRLPDMLQKAIVDKVVGKIKEAALTVNYDNPTQADDILNISTAADTTAAANTFKTSPSFKGTVKTDKGKVLVRRENLAEGLERDYEGEMAKSQLFSIVKNAKELFDMIDNSTQLEGWVQSKLTKAEDYISAVASYLEGQSITSTTPVMVAEEAVKDEEGTGLSIGDVVKAGDGGIYQIVYSHSMSKPFLVPFDLKKKKIGNLRTKIAFDSDSMIPKKLHKVMSHSATKGGFMK